MPEGEDCASAAAESVRSTGNRVLARTATAPAMKVPTRYKMMTSFICPPPFALHRALITRKNTRMGATLFRAFTKSVPSISMISFPGTTSARMVPMTRPTMMRLMRLIEFQARPIFLMVSTGGPFKYKSCAKRSWGKGAGKAPFPQLVRAKGLEPSRGLPTRT